MIGITSNLRTLVEGAYWEIDKLFYILPENCLGLKWNGMSKIIKEGYLNFATGILFISNKTLESERLDLIEENSYLFSNIIHKVKEKEIDLVMLDQSHGEIKFTERDLYHFPTYKVNIVESEGIKKFINYYNLNEKDVELLFGYDNSKAKSSGDVFNDLKRIVEKEISEIIDRVNLNLGNTFEP